MMKMVVREAMQIGKFGLSQLFNPVGLIIIALILLILAFMGLALGICCLVAPNIVGAIAFVIIGAVILLSDIVPFMQLRVGLGLFFLIMGLITFMWPGVVGLAVI
jgi:hypothetical protein